MCLKAISSIFVDFQMLQKRQDVAVGVCIELAQF